MSFLNLLKNEKKEIVLNIRVNVPQEVYKVKLYDYDKVEALKCFLISEGLSSTNVFKIIGDRKPFDRAWSYYNNPSNISYHDEIHRQVCLIKLLTIEGKMSGESFDSLMLACAQYFILYILIHMDFEYPTLKQLSISNRINFVEGLNTTDPDKVFRMIDYQVFDSISFCSTVLDMNLSNIYEYMIKLIEANNLLFERYWKVLNGKNVLFGIIGKILEMAFYNYKPSLKKINVNIKKDDIIIKNNNFYDFSNLKSVEGQKDSYYLEGKNKEIALSDISKILDIYNNALVDKGIKNSKPLSIDYLIEYVQSFDSKFCVFNIRYTPLTPTGKVAKNICSINFSINISKSPFLRDGIMYNDTSESSNYNNNAFGKIQYDKGGVITNFSISSNVLTVKGKDINNYSNNEIITE